MHKVCEVFMGSAFTPAARKSEHPATPHADAPGKLRLLAAHEAQVVFTVAPTAVLKRPVGQGVQGAVPAAAAKVPAGQGSQAAPGALVVPGGQATQPPPAEVAAP